MRLVLLFVVVPFVELFILLKLAELITGWRTFALVVITGIIGAALARHQGWQVIRRIQSETSEGRLPTTTVVDALMIFVAGALLITPGILTDILGFSLLVPRCRSIYRRWLTAWLRKRVHLQGVSVEAFRDAAPPANDQVIDSFVVDSSTTPSRDD